LATYVFVDEIQATIARDESGELLASANQLDTHALTHGRVRLLGLDTAEEEMRTESEGGLVLRYIHLLQNDALGVRGSSQRVSLVGEAQVGLGEVLVVPALNLALVH
jgi:hypothetical protein